MTVTDENGDIEVEEALAQAQTFAVDVYNTIKGSIKSNIEPFDVVAGARGSKIFITINSNPAEGIELHPVDTDEGAVPAFTLTVSYSCHVGDTGYLTVDKSSFIVGAYGIDQPLFHLDYIREAQSNIPGAHYNIHAHRDEFVYAMLQGGANPRQRRRLKAFDKRGRYPRISDLHFPVGGARFRPCLEDLIQMVVEEFGIATEPGWQTILEQGRRQWRESQLLALVWKNPELCARKLREKGYTVIPPQDEDGSPKTFEPDDRFTLY